MLMLKDRGKILRLFRDWRSATERKHGEVKAGDVTSFFNLMIDAILRAADVMMTNEIGPQLVKPTIHFCG
jgi:hypothetical protein